jgi:1-acyl-sn-glycerol-3-phosphate acyltransferase
MTSTTSGTQAVAFDPFGRDPDVVAQATPWLHALLDKHFDLQVEGAENVPAGRALLVANHGGALPWDAVVLLAGLSRAAARPVRPLVEDAVMTAPFLGTFMTRLGCVRASQDNAMRVLERDELAAVFPEGIQGLSKLWRQRHKLQRFGRGGFVRLAHKTGAPIVPVAVVGGEETAPLLFKIETFFRRNDIVPYLPVAPLLPLPARWRIRVGAPIDPKKELSDVTDIAVSALAGRIRDQIQRDVADLVDKRGTPYRNVFKWGA